MPLMLRDIVKRIVVEQPDMEIVGELSAHDDLVLAAREVDADFVIAGVDGEPPVDGHVLGLSSGLCVIAVVADGRRAYLYTLQLQRESVGALSADVLVSTIRANAHSEHRYRPNEEARWQQ